MSTETTTKRKRLTEDQKTKAKELLAKGFDPKVVADNIGTSVNTVYRLTKTERKTPEGNSFVAKVQKQFVALQTKQQFHQERADFYANQIVEIKKAFA